MKDFLYYIVKGIVKNEDSIDIVEEKSEDSSINLKLSVDKEDMGLIIGKEGRIIKSIRNLLKAKAIKEDVRTNLELVEIDSTN